MSDKEVGNLDPSWDEWLVVETLGFADGIEPTVVARGNQKRQFTRLNRQPGPMKVKETVSQVVAQVVAKGQPVVEPTSGFGPHVGVAACGVPIFGPESVVYGVQVWVGLVSATPPPPEGVGTFEFDVERQVTKHGPGHDAQILGLQDDSDTRTLQEIWKHFDRFDDEEAYREYLDALAADQFESGQEFAAEIYLTSADGVHRRIQMSVRSKQSATGRRIIGLLHDTTEGEKSHVISDRQIARAAAQLAAQDADAGLAQIDLNTGIVFEWLKTPPAPFDRWEKTNPEFDPETAKALAEARAAIQCGQLSTDTITATLRFPGDDDSWKLADLTISAIGGTDPQQDKSVRVAMIQIGVARTSLPAGMW